MRVRSLGQEDSPGGENGNPLQYSCLGDSMDRGVWRAMGCKESDMTEATSHTHIKTKMKVTYTFSFFSSLTLLSAS